MIYKKEKMNSARPATEIRASAVRRRDQDSCRGRILGAFVSAGLSASDRWSVAAQKNGFGDNA
jgi:hypothetical protein